MNQKLFLLIALFFSFFSSFSQCSYPSTASSVGTYTFCIDANSNTITTANVTAGQYALVNVVKGFNYTFSVGNVFATENLTLFNAGNDVAFGLSGYSSGSNGANINWTSPISGQIKILLSRGTCNNSDNGNFGPLTLKLVSLGNTQDSQTAFGLNQWVGHVYNHTDGPPPGGTTSPTSPSTTTSPFTAANYVGYYNISSETINEGFGGDNACFPVLSNGVLTTNIYTELFAVRYRMRSTRAAGCYLLNVNGDDGVRVYVDGVLVFNQWKQQGNTSYCNNLIYLNGNSDIVLDYYEHQGGNVVGFSLTPFDGSGNVITSSADVKVCSGVSPGLIDGAAFGNCTGGGNGGTNTIYQWQVSTNNTTFTDITGANVEDYTPPTVTTSGSDIIYYRRLLKAFATNAAACVFYSSSVKVTTSGVTLTTPETITGLTTQCSGLTNQIYSVPAVANASSYLWTIPSGWSGSSITNSINLTLGSSGGSITVKAVNACGTGAASSLTVTISPPSVSGSVSSNQNVCSGSSPANITLTGNTGTIQWQVSTDNSTFTNISGATSSSLTSAQMGLLTGTRYYRAVVTSGSCLSVNSSVVTITVNVPAGNQTSYGSNSWIGYVYASTNGGDPPTNVFTTNYVGYISQLETFDLNLVDASLSGPNLCNTYADNFSVRFKMNKNLTAGYYTFNVGGDDGYRLSLDSGSSYVINNWSAHSYASTTYTVYLSGNTNFILDYFENAGQSRVQFSYTFCATSTPPTAIGGLNSLCSGDVTTLTATGGNAAINSAYQWGTGSTVGNNIITGQTGISLNISPLLTTVYWVRRLDCSNTYPTAGITTTVTVNPVIASPTLGAVIHPTCSVKSSIVLNNLTISGTILQTGSVVTSYPITTTSMTISDIAPGTYNFVVSNGTCASTLLSNVVINPAVIPTTTWKGTLFDGWSNGPPTIDKKIIFDATYNSTVDLLLLPGEISGCSCEISAGKAVTFSPLHTLKIMNEVKVLGTLTFENTASLVQINNPDLITFNSGNIKYKRQTTIITKFDYTYWSSPVIGQKLLDVSPNTAGDKFYSFNAIANNWVNENTANPMVNAKGYIIRGPQFFPSPNPPADVHEALFVGIPNNGPITYTVGGAGTSNLIGNPYPSALDGDAFLKANNGVIDGTIYFWTHNTPITNNVYTSNDYAVYNLLGGVGTSAFNSGGNITKPDGKIASGQAFFVTSIASGLVTFNNNMRVGGGLLGVNNSYFFKTSNTKSKTTSSNEKNRLWLNLYNNQGAFKQTLVGYINGATNEYDNGYDGQSFDGNEFVDFYSVNQDKNLVIQGRALPFEETDEVPLGYRSSIAGDFSIGVDQNDGLFVTQNVFIEDKLLDVVHDLKESPYTFATAKGTFNDRFVLRYTNKTLGTGNFDKLESQIVISKDKNELKIKSELEAIKRITVFDILGRKIFEKDAVNNNEFRTSSIALNKQTGIVKVTLTNGNVISKKVIF